MRDYRNYTQQDVWLLRVAAKTAGYQIFIDEDGKFCKGKKGSAIYWKPLIDSSDAFELMVDCGIDLRIKELKDGKTTYAIYFDKKSRKRRYVAEKHSNHGDPHKATRQAIVRAAANIGANQD